ncbi:MAG: hypothetical protein AB7H77_00820 [Bdellovibrionales bacterium]
MAPQDSKKNRQNATAAWILVLAIATICCSALFLVFANYFVQINRNLAIANARLEAMEATQNRLLREIVSLHRAVAPESRNSHNAVPAKQESELSD